MEVASLLFLHETTTYLVIKRCRAARTYFNKVKTDEQSFRNEPSSPLYLGMMKIYSCMSLYKRWPLINFYTYKKIREIVIALLKRNLISA